MVEEIPSMTSPQTIRYGTSPQTIRYEVSLGEPQDDSTQIIEQRAKYIEQSEDDAVQAMCTVIPSHDGIQR